LNGRRYIKETKMKDEDLEFLKEELEADFKDVRINIPEADRLIVTAGGTQVMPMLSFLKNEGYDHLVLISCVDWIDEREFELVYILTPYSGGGHVILKTRISRENPLFPTATTVFKNASVYEREIHELFGINFEGHPKLSPLFLTKSYKVPPFRKDFDTRKYVEETFDSVPQIEDEK